MNDRRDDEIDVQQLAARLAAQESVVLLDVREPWENAIAALPNSVLIPLDTLPERLDELSPDSPIVVYCHHGMRSLSAAAWLARRGYTRIVSLRGGIDAWSVHVNPSLPRY